ncbi:hypothetical protein F2Q68_00024077 [Brassica cretica]|uniref:Uncharacterized protein n=1 Tax=Brassica cretica TaxID=69181 RepID=A0A8S9ICF1_BRACR|nr:hypothetical protein F2Q68_00024077 [Brassica cretica]
MVASGLKIFLIQFKLLLDISAVDISRSRSSFDPYRNGCEWSEDLPHTVQAPSRHLRLESGVEGIGSLSLTFRSDRDLFLSQASSRRFKSLSLRLRRGFSLGGLNKLVSIVSPSCKLVLYLSFEVDISRSRSSFDPYRNGCEWSEDLPHTVQAPSRHLRFKQAFQVVIPSTPPYPVYRQENKLFLYSPDLVALDFQLFGPFTIGGFSLGGLIKLVSIVSPRFSF